jgi:beta-lactamase regulating signal transducer with metallopeptidase domain
MSAIVQTALANAVLVTAASPVVYLIGRMARRPVLSHSLWLILLFKLLTPPLWTYALKLPQTNASAEKVSPAAVSAEPIRWETPRMATTALDVPRSEPIRPAPQEPERQVSIAPTPAAPAPVSTSIATPSSIQPAKWWRLAAPLFAAAWLAGGLLCLSVALIRVFRFSHALRWAIPASAAVQARADALARSVGLDHAPIVQFIPGPLCPMLWPVGRSARLLVPCALWDRLDSIQRDTVLIHELAHWARRDHWVRWVELLATSLYWWLPACWMARRQLRRAEEQCCDAWVMWAMPGSFQHYANALLEAVEFVSMPADRPSAVTAVPALASGMGQFNDLKGRLTMLKHGNISRALSLGGLTAVFGLGALLLPISPTIGQDAPQAEPATNAPQATPATDTPPPSPAPDAKRPASAAPEPAPPPATTEPENPLLSKQSTLDRLLYEKLDQMKLTPLQDATDAEYIRRLYLDLLKRMPSEDQIRQFVEDPAPSDLKRKVLLAKLLAGSRPQFESESLRESQKQIAELTLRLEQADMKIAELLARTRVQARQGSAHGTYAGEEPLNRSPYATGASGQPGSPYPAAGGAGPDNRPPGQAPLGTPPIVPSPDAPAPGGALGSDMPGDGKPGTRGTPAGVPGVPGEFQPQPRPTPMVGAPRRNPAERLDRLEAQLQAMLKEIDALKAERSSDSGAAPSPATNTPR